MISKEIFEEIIKYHQKQNSRIDKLTELGFKIWDTPVIDYGEIMFDYVITTNFDEDGQGWIYWWLFEHNNDNLPDCLDKDGSVIPTETTEDLWNIVEKYRV